MYLSHKPASIIIIILGTICVIASLLFIFWPAIINFLIDQLDQTAADYIPPNSLYLIVGLALAVIGIFLFISEIVWKKERINHIVQIISITLMAISCLAGISVLFYLVINNWALIAYGPFLCMDLLLLLFLV